MVQIPSDFFHRLSAPWLFSRIQQAQSADLNFAHYTSAAVAISILQNRSFWLRNSLAMNDLSEIKYGTNLIHDFLDSETLGVRFNQVLERRKKGLVVRFKSEWDELLVRREQETYLVCLSEHDTKSNPGLADGRLSMWRAYGGDTNVAFILRSENILNPTGQVPVFPVPVHYWTRDEFKIVMTQFVEALEENSSLLHTLDEKAILDQVILSLHLLCISIKHPGFKEEEEWRVVVSPFVHHVKGLRSSTRVIDGRPQKIYEFPLQNDPKLNLSGFEVDEILEEILIGPCQEPYLIASALVEELTQCNVKNPTRRIRVSKIPFRR